MASVSFQNVIAPVKMGDQILVPMGTKAVGTLKFVRRVGIGFAHERAIVDIDFTELTFPDGETVAWHAQVAEIENARESVDKKGDVKGISATGSIAYRASGAVTFLAFSNPVGVMFAMAGSSAVPPVATARIASNRYSSNCGRVCGRASLAARPFRPEYGQRRVLPWNYRRAKKTNCSCSPPPCWPSAARHGV